MGRVVNEREEHGDEEIEIILIPGPGYQERRQYQRYLVAGGVLGQVGGHCQVYAQHDQEGPQVGRQELTGEDQTMARIAQTWLHRDGWHSYPGLARHPQQGVRHQGVTVGKFRFNFLDIWLKA